MQLAAAVKTNLERFIHVKRIKVAVLSSQVLYISPLYQKTSSKVAFLS